MPDQSHSVSTGRFAVPSVSPHFWTPEVEVRVTPDRCIHVRQTGELQVLDTRITDRLLHWARETPDTVFLADRDAKGEWRRRSYAEVLANVQRIAASLLTLNLSAERPVVILSGADLEHAELALACMHVGIPYAALSEGYSLASTDHDKLAGIAEMLTPGLVFANDGTRFEQALAVAAQGNIPVYVVRNASQPGQRPYSGLLDQTNEAAVSAAHEAVAPETIAKFLFTSGSTGTPKAVINTNGMICANQAMVADCYRFMRHEPPVVLEWAPWNHTAAGNKVFFMVLFNGGTFYMDDGSPTPAGMAKTIRNLRDVSPTWYFNVPRGYEELAPVLDADNDLRDRFFARVKLLMYAGASLPHRVWEAMQRLSVEATGHGVLIASGLGATETSPFAFMCTWNTELPGNIGVPARGLELKLVPAGDKLEAHVRGPNVTPGYWRAPEVTAKAFDAEGYYNLGDALRFANPADPGQGLYFDGRTAENFKLRTGTWVNVAAVREKLINHFGGLIRDAAITGLDEDYLGALVFPDLEACRKIAGSGAEAAAAEILGSAQVRAAFAARLGELVKEGTGSSNTLRRLLLMAEPLSAAHGEITDKGGISQRAVLSRRADDVRTLYDESDAAIRADTSR